jgi:hypothetical protein
VHIAPHPQSCTILPDAAKSESDMARVSLALGIPKRAYESCLLRTLGRGRGGGLRAPTEVAPKH